MPIRTIYPLDIIQKVVQAIGEITFEPDPCIKTIIDNARIREESESAKDILGIIEENIQVANEDRIPLCQDTGTLVVFASLGNEVCIHNSTLQDILNEAARQASQLYYLRASLVNDPLFNRINTKDNTPVVLHLEQVLGDRLELHIAQKGGGAENMSRIKMFTPSANRGDLIDFVLETVRIAGSKACPPIIVGIGIGGNFETSAMLAKRALFDPLDQDNPNPEYAGLERDILKVINETGIGPAGMGGLTTAMAVKIKVSASHIASLPVSVNLQCHAHRHCCLTI
jgi:fumarate hydratase subunit alpha